MRCFRKKMVKDRKAYIREWKRKNRDKVREYNKKYCVNTPEAVKKKLKASSKQWKATNKERVLEYQRKWGKEHRDKVLSWVYKWRKNNPDKHRVQGKKQRDRRRFNGQEKQYQTEYRERNPELFLHQKRLREARRRALRLAAPGTCSFLQWIGRIVACEWKCFYCKIAVDEQTVTIDHRIPLSRGGSGWPSNLVPACLKCNLSKNAKTELEFKRLSKVTDNKEDIL